MCFAARGAESGVFEQHVGEVEIVAACERIFTTTGFVGALKQGFETSCFELVLIAAHDFLRGFSLGSKVNQHRSSTTALDRFARPKCGVITHFAGGENDVFARYVVAVDQDRAVIPSDAGEV
ncbi:MAG: hypothetical protein RI918_1840 [Pseudomonadota bacterium]